MNYSDRRLFFKIGMMPESENKMYGILSLKYIHTLKSKFFAYYWYIYRIAIFLEIDLWNRGSKLQQPIVQIQFMSCIHVRSSDVYLRRNVQNFKSITKGFSTNEIYYTYRVIVSAQAGMMLLLAISSGYLDIIVVLQKRAALFKKMSTLSLTEK